MSRCSELTKNRFTKKKATVEDIMVEIKAHEGHGTESNPEQYGDIFFDILMLSDVPKNDLIRFSEYALGTLEYHIKKYVGESDASQ